MTTQTTSTPRSSSESCNTMVKGKKQRRGTRSGRTDMDALTAAVTSQSAMNYETIVAGFVEMGIPADAITPRENVFTFSAWKALGRVVRKGQHGVKVCVFVPREKKDKETGEITTSRMPASTTVFHVSQTDELPTLGHGAGATAATV